MAASLCYPIIPAFNNLPHGTVFAILCGGGSVMKTKFLGILILLAGSSLFAAPRVAIGFGVGFGPAYGYAPAYYVAPPPPPPVVEYAPPVVARPGYSWVGGYWYPVGGRYYWNRGYWGRPPYAGAYWVAPRWYGGRYYRGYWR